MPIGTWYPCILKNAIFWISQIKFGFIGLSFLQENSKPSLSFEAYNKSLKRNEVAKMKVAVKVTYKKEFKQMRRVNKTYGI